MDMTRLLRVFAGLATVFWLGSGPAGAASPPAAAPATAPAAEAAAKPAAAPAAEAAAKPAAAPEMSRWTADHSKFPELQKKFTSGPEVTKACLTCHNTAADQIFKTEHWTWKWKNPKTGQLLGKSIIINDFCMSVTSNLVHCTQCHIGYNNESSSFPKDPDNIDCLVCHDTTGNYTKAAFDWGNPDDGIDLEDVAQHVGEPTRDNCGACHFYGGGGDGVKHGDLDSSLSDPDKAEDVHMAANGLNFTCQTCHKTSGHQVSGSRYAPDAAPSPGRVIDGRFLDVHGQLITSLNQVDPTTCQACHSGSPHKQEALNEHTDIIACQTCHIPEFARGGRNTEMSWDWSTEETFNAKGEPYTVRNEQGQPLFQTGHGTFTWAKNVVPTYIWFNGTVRYTLPTTKIDAKNQPIPINTFEGSPTDGKSRIWPVKIFRGKQPWDPVNHELVNLHEAPDGKHGGVALWEHYKWEPAIAAGMKDAGRPWSGKYAFVSTTMTWPINHMVAPASQALKCSQCHSSNGRLESISGVYIPGRGRDHLWWLDLGGWTLAGLTLLGVLLHGLARFIVYRRYVSRRKGS
jgi:octaheme c-type cytochrome (tetrathionate reductase family)